MLGCDLHCSYCQNWVTSQALRDPQRRRAAARHDARSRSSQDALPPGREARRLHLQRAAHHRRMGGRRSSRRRARTAWSPDSSRTATARRACSSIIRPHIDLYKVDLKSFDDRHYRELGGRLQPILDTIQWLHDAGVWVEIVTLLVPGFNDSERRAARPDRVPGRRLAGHPVARHGVPPGLPDDRPGEHHAGDAAARGRASAATRGCATSTRAICPAASASSNTRTATRAASG